ncbi:MAG: triose-phosphate isomerase [Bacteroidales bacterium]|nr:triose-phosphate isomerase [Bacteroidales bacterium]
MRKKIVAGNWKMNLTFDEAMSLVNDLKTKIRHLPDDAAAGKPLVMLFPPYVYIAELLKVFSGVEGVFVGAQNVHQKESGAYTGEISPVMLSSLGATHCLIGHSERRTQFGETDELLADKIKTALNNGIKPVYCCGELLPEREAGNHVQVVAAQLEKGLFWMDEAQIKEVIVAYEPVWAIGTGHTATPEQAGEMHASIRKLIREKYSKSTADQIPILYGGSCNAKNAAELFAQPDVDGGLIGGASLKADDFFSIINSF